MHLAATIAGDHSSLPQVTWLGENEFEALAIHGKRVELKQLQTLSLTLLKKAEMQMRGEVKMGLAGIKNWRWDTFEAEDDLSNIKEGYNFIGVSLKAKRMCLLEGFMENGATKDYFCKGMVGGEILWCKDKVVKWLKRCKKLLRMLMVLCHLLGGQPARSTEMATLRWRNSIHEQRGVYWANGTMMLLTIYSKTRGITSRDKVIPRYDLGIE